MPARAPWRDRAPKVVAVSPAMGPASIESHYDEALAVPGLLQEIAAGEREGMDGYVIACFGDPGLKPARELGARPGGGHCRGGHAPGQHGGLSLSQW